MRILGSIVFFAFFVALLTGCQSAPQIVEAESSLETITPADGGGTDTIDSAELAWQLSQADWCSNDQACSMLLLLLEEQGVSSDFDQRQQRLRDRGILKADWELQAEEPVTKGTLAYMLYNALEMKGGLMMKLIPSCRYAYRETVYQDLMLSGADYEPLSGPEVLGIFCRASRWPEK